MTKRWVVSGSLHTCFIAMDFFLHLNHPFTLSRTNGKWNLHILTE